jgi:hypothetical protein
MHRLAGSGQARRVPIAAPACASPRTSSSGSPPGPRGRSSMTAPSGRRKRICAPGRPSSAKPRSWTSRWWCRQRSSRLSSFVSPPRAQCRRWCASTNRLFSHPGERQVRSQAWSALRKASGGDGRRARQPRLLPPRGAPHALRREPAVPVRAPDRTHRARDVGSAGLLLDQLELLALAVRLAAVGGVHGRSVLSSPSHLTLPTVARLVPTEGG